MSTDVAGSNPAPVRPTQGYRTGKAEGPDQPQSGTPVGKIELAQAQQRADQLQHALTSRLTLEQAKGILKERYGLTPDQAFNLLRTTARNNRTNLHTLAADQLQHALTSRLTLEQAKGILKERYGLTPDQAFNLLRTTARNNRTNLHHLATEIVEKQDTPGALVETLARSHHAETAHQYQVTQLGRLAHQMRQRRMREQTRHTARGLVDDAHALRAQANVQAGRAARNLRGKP